MSELQPKPDTITKHLEAVYPSFALHAAMQLDIFTQLHHKSLSMEELAQVIDVQAYKLRPVLFILVQAGLLNYARFLFSNTPETDRYLVKGKPDYMGTRVGLNSSNWRRMLDTAEIVRAGKPPAAYDDPASPDEFYKFFRGLYPGAVEDAKLLLERHNFKDCEMLLDVGGGAGGLGITIAKANPELKATIIDLPLVTPITNQFVNQENVTDQVDVASVDAVNEMLPGTYDVVVARHLIQVLSPKDAGLLLGNISDAVNPGGKLFIIGYILDDSRQAPAKAVDFNLILITSSEYGEAYTEQEYRAWLENAGFVAFSRVMLPNGSSLISVTKPGIT
ncbi:MAG TPA: methyltransferase [Anaerolineales bacterium]|nr:methyltransferase [Anaerolineales bacterium]